MTGEMEHPLEATSPNPRRSNKIAEAIQSMAKPLDLPLDPDAQATVTDFLDFTEYLPSDMIRSLTLIGNLDQKYEKASAEVHDLTKTYGKLPEFPAEFKPDAVKLRADISQNLSEAVGARRLAHAEASRMARNIDRHHARAKNILAKLQAMAAAWPPERPPSPAPQKMKSPVTTRAPKITLRVDRSAAAAQDTIKVRKHRAPRITVPGEVLAPYELDYESYGSESDDYSEIETPATPAPAIRSLGNGRIKLKIPKNKVPKPPRAPRLPGMGTNVHSSVAGISTSNALAKLEPPPSDASPGSVHAPWLELTAWELAKLRKRMKKNAVWSPSDTMIARELKIRGRGLEAYRSTKAATEAAGEIFDHAVPPQLNGQNVDSEGAISVEALGLTANSGAAANRGLKLNDAKKMKKEKQAQELAKLAAEEAEESARKMAEAAQAMKGLFSKNNDHSRGKIAIKTASSSRKRKRDSEAPSAGAESQGKTGKSLKKLKTDSSGSAPPRIKTNGTSIPALGSAISSSSNVLISASTEKSSPIVPPSLGSPRKATTPILPPENRRNTRTDTRSIAPKPAEPVKIEIKKATRKDKGLEDTETAAGSRPRRTSATNIPSAPAPEPISTGRRPTSSRGKASSVEPTHQTTATATIDRPRRTSTARNTPAPESRSQNRRTKRPAPGIVTASSEGSAAVSVGKRAGAPRKKASQKKKGDGHAQDAVQIVYDEVDDEGNLIDPDEPRYCFCHRVSFGEMICCENDQVSLSLLRLRIFLYAKITLY